MNDRPRVCVQGLGFVGSAMAAATARATNESGAPCFDVVGVDLPTKAGKSRVDAINNGRFPFETSDTKLQAAVQKAAATGNLRASTDVEEYRDADIVIVDVHLDIPFLDDEPQLEFDGFKQAISSIGERIKPNTLVIIETTVPPGTCQKIVYPTLLKCFVERGLEPSAILLAHSYERVMPGKDYLDSIINFWRVYSGYSEPAADMCEDFLKKVINTQDFPLKRLSSTTASETAKVLENTFRAMNIAFVCEWTRYSEQIGIDLYEVVDAIQTRPTHANLRYPGLGIGGYCLTKDPAFAPAAAKQLFGENIEFPFSKLAISEAADMPIHGVNRLEYLLGGSLKNKRVLLCGISYRQDVADTRFSPSQIAYQELSARGAEVSCHDPVVGFWEEMKMDVPVDLPKSEGLDAVLFAIPHLEYKNLDLSSWISNPETLVLDAFMVFDAKKRKAFRKSGVKIEALGVGEGL